jgi:hypothetical protein
MIKLPYPGVVKGDRLLSRRLMRGEFHIVLMATVEDLQQSSRHGRDTRELVVAAILAAHRVGVAVF